MRQLNSSSPSESPGDLRAGAALASGGALLLGLMLVRGWPAPTAIPVAIAVALIVFGAFLLALSLATRIRQGRGPMAPFDGHLEPVFLTDRAGRVLARNAAAPRRSFLEAWLPDADAALYRLAREARTNGVAVASAADGSRRVVATCWGRRRLLWRIERMPSGGAAGDLPDLRLPWLRIDAGGAVRAANPAATALLGAHPDRLEEMIADLPLRPGGVHMLAASSTAVRAVVHEAEDGMRDLLFVPLGDAEIAGLVPDAFLEELPVALARLETDGQLVYANGAARMLLGERIEPGVKITELIEGLGRPIAERLADTARGRALGRSEVARGTAGGQEIFLQVAFTRTVLDGRPSVLAVLADATELKTLEAQFVQSQKMQAVGQLAGGVAHDFNNLLTAINGHCDLLLMRHDVADVEHGDLMQIRQNANRAAALVRQLLAFSRKQTLRPTVINLQDTLSELTHLLNRLLTERVTLRIEHGPDLRPVRVDERQFEQVIMNLVVNARDAMPRGGEVRITTQSLQLERDLHRDRAVILKGDYVVIEVADSGTGIPEGKLNKIFEPFYTTKQVGEGTGLGLSTAYGIIKQTGGFIFAESPPGKGAVFTIYLPAYETSGLAPAPEPEVRRPRDLSGRGLVMLVEDEDAVRSFAARALQLRGYTVIEAASGEEALEILKDANLHIDIMVSDVIMPGLDGPGWVREARKARPDTKVIFVSGYAEDAFAGGDGGIPNSAFLPKPFTLPELTQKVKEMLDA